MKTFKQYLEDRQMMMFSTKPVELYHGSNTGADNSVLNSFIQNGIKPDIAHGHGQGAGFYVWSDRNSAINHTKAITADSITTRSRNDGRPMIVTVEAIADPEKWDLDYEANKKVIVTWLHDNFERLQPLLDADVQLRAKYQREILDDQDRKIMAKGVTVGVSNGKTQSRSTFYAHDDSSLRVGDVLGAVMNKLQQKDPNVVYKFEELLFANMRPGFALKYVGNENLKPKRIEVFENGSWATY